VDIDYEQFGPQAHHLKALIDRIYALTPQQAELLATQWNDTWIDDEDWVPPGWRALLHWRELPRIWRKRRRVNREVNARMIARARAGSAARDEGRDTRALVVLADDLARRAAHALGDRTEAGAAHAAKDAARALAARDAVSAAPWSDWRPEHYQLLTQPWRTVIGPVHPGDK